MTSAMLQKYMERELGRLRTEYELQHGGDPPAEQEQDWRGQILAENILNTEATREKLGDSQMESMYEILKGNYHLRPMWSKQYETFEKWLAGEVVHRAEGMKLTPRYLRELGNIVGRTFLDLKRRPVTIRHPLQDGTLTLEPEDIIYNLKYDGGKYEFDRLVVRRLSQFFNCDPTEYMQNLFIEDEQEFREVLVGMHFKDRKTVAGFIKRAKGTEDEDEDDDMPLTHFPGRKERDGEQRIYVFDKLNDDQQAFFERLIEDHVLWE